jgi:nucleoside-diphosphate-sugar epimerase
MVIGNGMVAKRFESYKTNDQFLIFASGVSNSKNINPAAYERELTLLQKAIKENPEKILVYFSTCSIYDPEEETSKYVLHKKQIENLIQKDQKQFYIFRVSNLVGQSGNRNTILNFYVYHILNGINFDLWTNAIRNLIDIDDMYRIVDHILKNRVDLNKVINIANEENYTTAEIITLIEAFLDTRANYIPITKGNAFIIDTSATKAIMKELGIHFEKNYLTNLLRKYYNRS